LWELVRFPSKKIFSRGVLPPFPFPTYLLNKPPPPNCDTALWLLDRSCLDQKPPLPPLGPSFYAACPFGGVPRWRFCSKRPSFASPAKPLPSCLSGLRPSLPSWALSARCFFFFSSTELMQPPNQPPVPEFHSFSCLLKEGAFVFAMER